MKLRFGIGIRILLATSLAVAGLPLHGAESGSMPGSVNAPADAVSHANQPPSEHGSDCASGMDTAAEPADSGCEQNSDDCCSGECEHPCAGLVLLVPVRFVAPDFRLQPSFAATDPQDRFSRTPTRLLRPPRT